MNKFCEILAHYPKGVLNDLLNILTPKKTWHSLNQSHRESNRILGIYMFMSLAFAHSPNYFGNIKEENIIIIVILYILTNTQQFLQY